ncbi:lysophospholipid acyltransferase 7-like isoform X1 [Corticium candelabrum]|uniref:lysophospholipid acyltransferase 7-like isoform X1 n=1 Tax=Corticium candelabrum TaxID=121492 RepID=UPI002E259D1C|nr:lysophospholipid acyltransferase 7-like isoform X1 [Corticium candelabrum]
MKWDDAVYLALLLSSVLLGHAVKRLNRPQHRLLFTGLAGFCMALYICGTQIWHSLFVSTSVFLIIKFMSRKICHIVGFWFAFGYLLFFRSSAFFGVEYPLPYTNAIQLLLTLKVVSVAFDAHDADVAAKSKSDKENANWTYSPLGPNHPLDDPTTFTVSLTEYYCYIYCFIGLFTGPFVQLKLYRHMIHRSDTNNIRTVVPALRRLSPLPVFGLIFLIVGNAFPDSQMITEEFLELGGMWGFTYRYLYLIPVFLCFRLRFYIGWLIAESSCITAALGAYPFDAKCLPGRGPTVPICNSNHVASNGDTHSFESVRNLDIYEIESCVTMGHSIKHWNMTVQTWLVYNVYKRFPIKSLRYACVFLVSSFWHGIYPGYYLCLLSTTIYGAMESRLAILCKPLWEKANRFTYALLYIIGQMYRMHSFEYVAVGFILLEVSPTLAVWRADYFYYHIFGVVMLVIMLLVPSKRRSVEKQSGGGTRREKAD